MCAVIVCGEACAAAGGKAAAPPDRARGTVKTTFHAFDPKQQVIMRSWAIEPDEFKASGNKASVKIGENFVTVEGRTNGRVYLVGLDADQNGTVERNELQRVPPTRRLVFSTKLGGRDFALLLFNISMHYGGPGKGVDRFNGKVLAWSSMAATINGVPVHLIDENFNGTYNQKKGGDGIIIGDAKLTLPLRSVHRIGERFYRLTVAGDGSTIAFQRLDDVKVGLVGTPIPAAQLTGLVLASKEGAFDLVGCAKTGIPEGTYKLSYGLLGGGSVIQPSEGGTVQYAIQAGMKNLLRMGPPFILDFEASFHQDKRKIQVKSAMYARGAGGGMYTAAHVGNPANPQFVPVVAITAGGRPILKKRMSVKGNKVHDFWCQLPPQVNPATLGVVVTAVVPDFGSVSTAKSLKDIYNHTPLPAVDTTKPAVKTSPWDRKNGKTAKRPLPSK